MENGDAAICAIIDWKKARSFLRFVLGWSYADKGAPFKLHRENPIGHPRFSWLHASTVTFSSIAPKGVQGVGTKVDGAFFDSLPVAQYQKILATVRFTDKFFPFFEDDETNFEWERNTLFDPVPSIEIISAEGLNNIKFGEGDSRGVAVPAPFGTLMSKMAKTFNWFWVPHEYISGSDTTQFNPTKILNCVGKVNSVEWNGHPAGTLLLQAPAFQRFRFPLQTNTGFYGYFGWNVKLPMQFFDPPRGGDLAQLTVRTSDSVGTWQINGISANFQVQFKVGALLEFVWTGGSRVGMAVTAVNPTTGIISLSGGTGDPLPAAMTGGTMYGGRGHQLVPRRIDLKWYTALRQDGTSKLYSEADFATIFNHINAP